MFWVKIVYYYCIGGIFSNHNNECIHSGILNWQLLVQRTLEYIIKIYLKRFHVLCLVSNILFPKLCWVIIGYSIGRVKQSLSHNRFEYISTYDFYLWVYMTFFLFYFSLFPTRNNTTFTINIIIQQKQEMNTYSVFFLRLKHIASIECGNPVNTLEVDQTMAVRAVRVPNNMPWL